MKVKREDLITETAKAFHRAIRSGASEKECRKLTKKYAKKFGRMRVEKRVA